jgi:hypothetical protein
MIPLSPRPRSATVHSERVGNEEEEEEEEEEEDRGESRFVD